VIEQEIAASERAAARTDQRDGADRRSDSTS
jgi:hypothetical protein